MVLPGETLLPCWVQKLSCLAISKSSRYPASSAENILKRTGEGTFCLGIQFTDLKDFWAHTSYVRYRLLHNVKSHRVIIGMQGYLSMI